MNISNNMSGRVGAILPDDVFNILKMLADRERRSQSQMAAILIEEALKARGEMMASERP